MYIDILIFGIFWTAVYSIAALGFSIIFGVARILNLAHGAIIAVACYLVYTFSTVLKINATLAIGLSVVIVILIGLAIYKGLFEPIRTSLSKVLILSTGLAIFMGELLFIFFGPQPQVVPTILKGGFRIRESVVSYQQLFAVVVIAVILLGVWFFISKTKEGRILRAVAQDYEMAQMLGINPIKIFYGAMGLSCFLGAIGGALVAPFLPLTPEFGWTLQLPAFTIVILGGLGSIRGTILAAFIVGFSEVLTAFLLSPQLKEAVTFGIMFAVIVMRPHGLFGRGLA